MTTTTDEVDAHVLMRFARYAEVITGEYHPHDGAMPYSLHVTGGRNSGVVIHCKTAASVLNLFNDVVTLHHQGIIHPYLAPV